MYEPRRQLEGYAIYGPHRATNLKFHRLISDPAYLSTIGQTIESSARWTPRSAQIHDTPPSAHVQATNVFHRAASELVISRSLARTRPTPDKRVRLLLTGLLIAICPATLWWKQLWHSLLAETRWLLPYSFCSSTTSQLQEVVPGKFFKNASIDKHSATPFLNCKLRVREFFFFFFFS